MGSPSIVDPVAFVLRTEGTVQIPSLEPEQYFEILMAAVAKAQPHFRQLSWKTFEGLFSDVCKDARVMPFLHSGLTYKMKCLLVMPDRDVGRYRFVIITRNGRVFLWYFSIVDTQIPHRIVLLTPEVFLRDFDGYYSEAVRRIIEGLRTTLNGACRDLEFRLHELDRTERWLDEVGRRLSPASKVERPPTPADAL